MAKQVVVRVSDDMDVALQRYARQHDLTGSQVVRMALKKLLALGIDDRPVYVPPPIYIEPAHGG